ncbi:5'-3' exonuclease [Paenibacillus solanacearum]|uniref:5'-3' exonuclease n=1 Tax=Paenibacillus solanacearum TaxID=2048548 RepID=A0A916NW34_9BACL|nr:5'-3' exonuclease H3TH domain-containing protein [Paenibacillus solanacearum]CAG7613658.1 5'-3' exonuclease [Paenibacillus solanacearum]
MTTENHNMPPKVLMVDGMALLFRAFYATSYGGYIMKTKAGVPTNAVFGFVKYFWDAVQRFKPSHVVCCWDMGSKTFRSEQFSDYKANRVDCPEELIPQFDLVKEMTASFGVVNIGVPGFEADDCIGTLAKLYGEEAQVYILTGDHDMLQLVSDTVHVVIMKKGQGNYAVYTPKTLLEEKQLTPQQIIDLKGLMGDTADNYPGVKGIGEKTALKLLIEYGSVDGILENMAQLPKGVRSKIEAQLDMLHLSRSLATICLEAPVACALESCFWEMDRQTVLSKFEELEFKGLDRLIG